MKKKLLATLLIMCTFFLGMNIAGVYNSYANQCSQHEWVLARSFSNGDIYVCKNGCSIQVALPKLKNKSTIKVSRCPIHSNIKLNNEGKCSECEKALEIQYCEVHPGVQLEFGKCSECEKAQEIQYCEVHPTVQLDLGRCSECEKVSQVSIETYQKAIIETAAAFYRRGENVQYCTDRKNYNMRPEEATDDNTVYVVCSAFVQSVYKDALGIELPGLTRNIQKYAANNKNSEFVIEYKEGTINENGDDAYTRIVYSKDNIKNFVDELADKVQPGDIVTNLTKDGSGHTMLVYEVNKDKTDFSLLHANGDSWDVEEDGIEYEKNGAILEEKSFVKYLTDKEKPTRGSYLYNSISVIRPLANGKYFIGGDVDSKGNFISDNKEIYYGLTESAKGRLDYSNIDIIKTGSFHNNSIVDNNNTITYTIKIKNNDYKTNNRTKDSVAKAYENLVIEEVIPDSVSVTDASGGEYKNGKIKWTISLKESSEYTLQYTVKVKDTVKADTKIVSTGTVGGIRSATITNVVGNRLDKEQRDALRDAVESISTESTGMRYINEVYKKAGIGIETLRINGTEDTIGIKDMIVKDTKKTEEAKEDITEIQGKAPFGEMIVADMANTYDMMNYYRHLRKDAIYLTGNKESWSKDYDTYIKNPNENSLQTGDVLVIGQGNDVDIYLCLNNNISGDNNSSSKLKLKNTKTKKTISDAQELKELFSVLPFQDYFLVLSPALTL